MFQSNYFCIIYYIILSIFKAAATLSGLHVRRVPFQWTPSTFSFFTAICKVSGVIGMITLVPMFQKVLGSKSQQSDLTLTGIGFGFIALECLALFVASSSYHLIVGESYHTDHHGYRILVLSHYLSS